MPQFILEQVSNRAKSTLSMLIEEKHCYLLILAKKITIEIFFRSDFRRSIYSRGGGVSSREVSTF